MNWIEGNTEWGTVKCPKGISVKKTSSQSGDIITERYTFMNTTDKDIFTSLKDISIYTPFNDDYTCGAKACTVSSVILKKSATTEVILSFTRHLSHLCRMKVLRLNGNYFGITARTIFTAKLINYAIALSMFRLKILYCSAVKISI